MSDMLLVFRNENLKWGSCIQ